VIETKKYRTMIEIQTSALNIWTKRNGELTGSLAESILIIAMSPIVRENCMCCEKLVILKLIGGNGVRTMSIRPSSII